MRVAVIGAGAVGGYYAALMARSGVDVGVVARGAHLDAIRSLGIRVISDAVGHFAAPVAAEDDPARLGPVDVVIYAVKTYDNPTALPLIRPLLGPDTVVLTLQNGVDSPGDVAAAVGEARVIAGPTYVATAIDGPGVIRQTGSHRRIVFGECFDVAGTVSPRVRALEAMMKQADIHAEAVADSRVPLWEKFIYLAPFAAVTGAARLPIGPIWSDADGRAAFLDAVEEVHHVAVATGIPVGADARTRVSAYVDTIPPSTRSSLLIDLSSGKRIEVESLPGSVVRRGRATRVPTPIMSALYAVLKPHAAGARA